MRLIGSLNTEKEAQIFSSFLSKEGIINRYEPFIDVQTGVSHYRIWVQVEEEVEVATDWLERFQQDPQDAVFHTLLVFEQAPLVQGAEEERSVPASVNVKRRYFRAILTYCIIALCAVLFFWDVAQKEEIFHRKGKLAAELAMTPLKEHLLFDYPYAYASINAVVDGFSIKYKTAKELSKEELNCLEHIEDIPVWKGIYPFLRSVNREGWAKARTVPWFEKIRQGQVWRLFTPALLHHDFLHILFNMVWAWLLLKQLEARLSLWKLLMLIACIGIVSNTAQYLASGPNFIGFSGVVVGLAGFIWMRQRKAPWEGYPLQKGTLLFLLLFVLAMVALELVMFALEAFSMVQITLVIANTAHVVGGLTGMILGRLSMFSRSPA